MISLIIKTICSISTQKHYLKTVFCYISEIVYMTATRLVSCMFMCICCNTSAACKTSHRSSWKTPYRIFL